MEDSSQRQLNKGEELALSVLNYARNSLLVNLRFLDSALSRLKPIPYDDTGIMTDGEHLIYGYQTVLKEYKNEQTAVTRNYLHLIIHCIYRHMFINTLVDRQCWNLACDIAVEYSISGLNLKAVDSLRSGAQQAEFEKLKKEVPFLTAEKLYRYFLDRKLSPMEMANLRGLFYGDDHAIWYMTNQEKEEAGLLFTPDNGENPDGEPTEVRVVLASEADWKDISERIQIDLETFFKSRGVDPGNMVMNLNAVNREKYDYTAFLKKFAVLGEAMKVNDDEFDYIFYTYGLKLYKKMPLIEPLEYKDVKKIREFVIAIDTSGSVLGEQVQSFIQKTYNILKSTESFFSKINLHIIQCDAEIQEDVKITTQEEFDRYLKSMKLKGFGGTDFRPVFARVDEMLTNGEFTNLKGLIYLTDGYGMFPPKKPAYETAFVFVDRFMNNTDVPPWAIKLIIDKEELA